MSNLPNTLSISANEVELTTIATSSVSASPHEVVRIHQYESLDAPQDASPSESARSEASTGLDAHAQVISQNPVSSAEKSLINAGSAMSYADVPAIRLRNLVLRVTNKMHTADKDAGNASSTDSIAADLSFGDDKLTILKHLDMSIPRNKLTALMGASGCGKSTLLAYLGGRRQADGTVVTGEAYYCGMDMTSNNPYDITIADLAGDATATMHSRALAKNPNDRSVLKQRLPRVGFVLQHDTLCSTLTVFETLLFAAHMTLAYSHPDVNDRIEIVNDIINALGLSECRDTLIGGPEIAGCSGGERRRVSVGIQLLNQPDILLLDEPTTGLDSTSAASLVRLLYALTRGDINLGSNTKATKVAWKPMTIVVAIHQPRQDVFEYFDHVSLMARGVMLYDGSRTEMDAYFQRVGYPTPARMNPADHYIDVSSVDARSLEAEAVSSQRVNFLALEWRMSPKGRLLNAPESPDRLAAAFLTQATLKDRDLADPELAVSSTRVPPFFYQVRWLLWRWTKIMYRDKDALLGNFVQAVISAILLGIIFVDQGLDEKGMRGRTSVCFSITILYAYTILLLQITLQTQQIKLYYQESEAKFYRAPAFMLSRELLQLPMYLILTLIYTLTLHGMAGMNAAEQWYRWAVALFAIASAFSMCALSSVAVAITPDYELASMIANLYYIFGAYSCGFFVSLESVPRVIRWIRYIEPFYYSFQNMAHLEFSGVQFQCPVGSTPAECEMYTGDFQLRMMGIDNPNYVTNTVIAFVITIAMYALALLILTLGERHRARFPKLENDTTNLLEASHVMAQVAKYLEATPAVNTQKAVSTDYTAENLERTIQDLSSKPETDQIDPKVQAALEILLEFSKAKDVPLESRASLPLGIVQLRSDSINAQRAWAAHQSSPDTSATTDPSPSSTPSEASDTSSVFKWIPYKEIEGMTSREPVSVLLKDLSLGVISQLPKDEAVVGSVTAVASDDDDDFTDNQVSAAASEAAARLKPTVAERAAQNARTKDARLKWLFQSLNVEFKPGQLWAVMGGSGSGKTSLLSFIAQRLDINTKSIPTLPEFEKVHEASPDKLDLADGYKVFGGLYFNDQPTTHALARSYVGLVTQFDSLLPALTVRETLMFAASLRLRLPNGILKKLQDLGKANPEAEIPTEDEVKSAWVAARVDHLIRELGLVECADTLIGGESVSLKGLSGGQKRRVTIAIQMLTDPSVLLLDEPTSGLDSFMAYNVAQTLRHIATDRGRTVVATLHQPRVDVFSTFTHCIIMSKSNVAYVGPTKLLWSYFSSVPQRYLPALTSTPVEIPPCPEGMSVSDWVLDICSIDTTARTGESETVSVSRDDILLSMHRDKTRIRGFVTLWRAYESARIIAEARREMWPEGEAYYGEAASAGLLTYSGDAKNASSEVKEHNSAEELYETVCERCGAEYTILRLRGFCPAAERTSQSESNNDGSECTTRIPSSIHKFVRHRYEASQTASQDVHQNVSAAAPAVQTVVRPNEAVMIHMSPEHGSDSLQPSEESKTMALVEMAKPDHTDTQKAYAGHVVEVQDLQEADVWTAYKLLLRRSMVNLSRQPVILTTRLSNGIFFSIFTLLFYTSLNKDQTGLQDRIGLITSLQSYGYVSVMNCLVMFPPERDLFHRERSDGLYGVVPFMLSYFSIEIVVSMISIFLNTVLYAFPVQMSLLDHAANYFAFAYALLCLALFAESLSIICLILCHHVSLSMAVITIVYNVLEPMSSLYSPESNMWAPVRYITRINPLRYYAHIAVNVEFKDTTFYCTDSQLIDGACPFVNGRDYIPRYGYNPSELGENIAILAGLIVFYRIVAVLCLKYQWRRIRAASAE